MTVIGATQLRCSHEDVSKAVPEERLYLLLAGPENRLGAACLDLACVSSIIQKQTMGTLLEGPTDSRPFTSTDAAMVAPLLEGLFSRAEDLADSMDDRQCLNGYEFCARLPDRRSVGLALAAERYRVFDLTIEIEAGKAQGHGTLILPDFGVQDGSGAAAEVPSGPALSDAAGMIRVDLNAELVRIRLTLSELYALTPGAVLPLVGAKLDKTHLTAIDERRVAQGRLGQCRGMRALRLNEKLPEPSEVTPYEDSFVGLESKPIATSRSAHPSLFDEAKVQEIDGAPLDVQEGQAPLAIHEATAAEISALAGLGEDEFGT
ncbi:FliM/FliN family flagellar motor C-terminal domain-containing protein [Lutimaribacter marinistellae]|uniref:FliM/FliN family flagellar motor C-terminal domain-containing protein n=1 Tax=Lutimaribacter marinistellae TaxID=1820329 RepID=A0ABV7TFG6_9RHOB